MRQILSVFALNPDLQPSCLGVSQIRAASHLKVFLLSGGPGLHVAGFYLQIRQISGAALQGSHGNIQGPEQILEKVRGKFELLILDFEVLVEEMRLIYYPILENLEEAAATLQPVWEVQIEVEGNHINYYFDGETGKELVW